MRGEDLRSQIFAHLELFREQGIEHVDLPDESFKRTQTKADALDDLWTKYVNGCTRCELANCGRSSIVFGDGSPTAEIMFVGEGPGAEEDKQGLPFVGRAGQKLNEIIRAMGFERQDVYIANIVKCRPPGNRSPESAEIAACLPYLEAQIKIIQPKVICALGSIAAQTLLNDKTPISRMRGTFYSFRGVALLPTYHPAYLLRNYTPKTRREIWEDMQKILKFLKDSR